MAFLTSQELADARTHYEQTMPATCAIYYITRTADGAGGQKEVPVARGTAIPCRLAEANFGSYSGITAAQMKEGQVWYLTVPYDQTVARDDKVVISGNTYRVQQINEDESDLFARRVRVVRWA